MENDNKHQKGHINQSKIDIKTARSIYDTDYGEEQTLIEGLLPAIGLVLLCGPFKCGKSFFSQLLMHCISTATDFLGKKLKTTCQCLYLALEDTERRIKKRFEKMEIIPTDNLLISTKWSYFKKGIEDLRKYLVSNPKIKAVLIDTLGMFSRFREDSGYQADYDFMSELRNLAFELNVLIIFTHHTRKLRDEYDIYNEVSGSVANMGAADTILLIKRPRCSSEATLYCISRDFEENIIKIQFDNKCRWNSDGTSTRIILSPERQRILDVLIEHGELRPKEIAEKLPGKNIPKNISNLLASMKEEGLVKNGSKRGLWKAVEETNPSKNEENVINDGESNGG